MILSNSEYKQSTIWDLSFYEEGVSWPLQAKSDITLLYIYAYVVKLLKNNNICENNHISIN